MRILILGGSGRTGKLVIDEALRRGHTVTALVRKVSSLEPRVGLTVVEGSPLKKDDIEAAFTRSGGDSPGAVIITLNAVRKTDNPWSANISPPRLMADANANAVAVMKEHGGRKIATMSSFGVGDSWPYMSWIIRAMVRHSNMSYQFEDHDLADKELKESGVDYVLARPVVLKDGEAQPLRQGLGDLGANKGLGVTARVTRKSVALFLVDAAESNRWDKSTPVLAN